ncbi:MAG: VOC family protein [Candidatus Binataceae bacterium]
MELTPYLMFNGQCEAAFRLYEKVLGGKIEMKLTYGESPEAGQTASEWRDKIMHARFSAGAILLMGSDAPPDRYEKPAGFAVSFSVEDPVEAERIFNALAEHGTVRMPLAQTFWARRFGMLNDQFGIPWMINCE